LVLNRAGLVNRLETTFLDWQMRLDVPDEESQVVIVDITQKDFENVFRGQTRPLQPDALRTLINAVAKGQPCVIAVDVDTHFAQFKDFNVSNEWPPSSGRGRSRNSPPMSVKSLSPSTCWAGRTRPLTKNPASHF